MNMGVKGNLGCPGVYYESGVVDPIPIHYLVVQITRHPHEFIKCFSVETLEEAVGKLNSNNYIYGKYYLNKGHIYGKLDNKTIRI